MISKSGLWLGAAPSGTWVVGRVGGAAHEAHGDPRGLMTWLERPWSVARAEREEVQGRRPDLGPVPLAAAVRLALEWETDYWPSLALGWLSDGYPIDGLEEYLVRLQDAHWLPQRSRHLARRLLRSHS